MADGDLFTNAGFQLPSKTGGTAAAAQAAGSLFKDAGFHLAFRGNGGSSTALCADDRWSPA
jgi:hypothetical protein